MIGMGWVYYWIWIYLDYSVRIVATLSSLTITYPTFPHESIGTNDAVEPGLDEAEIRRHEDED